MPAADRWSPDFASPCGSVGSIGSCIDMTGSSTSSVNIIISSSSDDIIYRVATDQIWDTEQFTGIELQKKYRISQPHTEPFTE